MVLQLQRQQLYSVWNVRSSWEKEDTDRQALNVYRMELLGAKVHAVTSGTMTLKDAVNEAMREWSTRVSDTHYVLGSVMGPHPFPMIVGRFPERDQSGSKSADP